MLEGFAGPGGFSEAAAMLGEFTTLPGIELNVDACATAGAAGYPRLRADIRTLDPAAFAGAVGWASGPPCPSYSDAGLRSGRGDTSMVINGLTAITGPFGDVAGAYQGATDPRTPLVLETLRFALMLPDVEWLVAEQVPAVKWIWENLASELAFVGWRSAAVLMLRADDFGVPTRRRRGVLMAARTWYRTDLGSVDGRLSPTQAGLLNGFPAAYPWQGKRTSQFQQVADAVPPPMAAALLAVASGRPWLDSVWARLADLYGVAWDGSERLCDGARRAPAGQRDLFELAG